MGLNIKNKVVRFFLKSNPPFFSRFRPLAVESLDQIIAHDPEIEVYREKGNPVKLQPPILNDSRYLQNYSSLFARITPDRFILKLNNGRIWGGDAAVITNDSVLIKDVSRQFGMGNDYAYHAIFKTIIIHKPNIVNGNVGVVSTAGSSVYYHWMLDIVPRILLLKEQELDRQIDYYILNYTGLAFQEQTLAMLGIRKEQCLVPEMGKQFHFQANAMFVPSLPSHLNEVNLRECEMLVKWLAPFSSETLVGYERIYVSRKKTGTRFVVNETELLELLEPMGFVSVDMESYTVSEQIKLFQTARIIVGPHGSAFTNIIFSEPGARLVDILPNSNIVSCFYGIAAQLGISYFGFIGEGVSINSSRKNDSIKIDTDHFRKFLREEVLN